MKITKRLFCYILVGFLTFGITASSYYRSVHAFEWVGGALAFEEALKWGLALLGITATAGMTDAYWDNYSDEFTEYAIENGATQTEVAEWQLKLCEGILDKGSSVWDSFKAWSVSLDSENSSGNIQNGLVVNAISSIFTIPDNFTFDYPDYNFNYACAYFHSNGNKTFYFLSDDCDVYSLNANRFSFKPITGQSTCHYYKINFRTTNSQEIVTSSGSSVDFNGYDNYLYGFDSWQTIIDSTSYLHNWDIITSNNDFDSAFTSDIINADVISSVLPDENDSEVSIPMPGLSDSDDVASSDAYQDIVDAINDGTITQEQGLERIQEILKVIVYDTVTDDVLPIQEDPDTGENKKKEEAIQENKDNMGFTLGGLENVFPFCIPFDIYAFMTLLVAEPVAPEFDYPIQSVNGEVEEIHVDLTPFEPVAVVVRYIFDFLFIIGLGILTRSLIGGGGSD